MLTRQHIQEEREKTRGVLLVQCLELHPNQVPWAVWSSPDCEKHLTAWLLCLPSSETSYSAAEFSLAMAALLCLPSPACAPLVGQTITVIMQGRQQDSGYIWYLCSNHKCGDGWRIRHDSLKWCIAEGSMSAGCVCGIQHVLLLQSSDWSF